jgi:hypothetical protein
MNSSSVATSALRETYVVYGAAVQCTPKVSQASRKIAWMSAEWFLKEYRGFDQPPRPVF